MTFLRSILVVYVSLYLILPGCLCQILTVFGCEDALHASVAIDLPVEVAPVNEVQVMACHCDELVDKAAEVQSAEVFESASLLLATRVGRPSVYKLAGSNAGYPAGSRAPPGGSFWTLTSRSGVFLI
ncbi:MAG: hypothetical protein P1U86_07560 [Verrucomicrobiales bacterium]|nr:hypothetical protein [Verrucomicrobiales bacterium]